MHGQDFGQVAQVRAAMQFIRDRDSRTERRLAEHRERIDSMSRRADELRAQGVSGFDAALRAFEEHGRS